MPPKRMPSKTSGSPVPTSSSRAPRCTAKTTSGDKCRRAAVTGLTVCKSHGGGTAASVRKSTKAVVSKRAAQLWGISEDTSGISIVDELNKLARNKLTDILAIRIELSSKPTGRHGLLKSSVEITEAEVDEEVYTTVKTKKSAGVHPLVQELHKAEQELIQILRLLHEVTGNGDSEQDSTRVRMQVAREAARLMKGFPGMSVEDVAAEVGKRA